MESLKVCSKCREGKPRSEFHADPRRYDGLYSSCKECKRANNRISNTSEHGKKRKARWDRANYDPAAQRVKNQAKDRSGRRPDKFKNSARIAVRNAVASGTLQRPSSCSDCGVSCKPHGHHEDYSKKLEVVWLCQKCHAKRHRKYEFPELEGK